MTSGSISDGIVTVFLMGDLAGSTANWLRAPEAMDAALRFHDELVASVVAATDGTLFKHTGDGFIAQFDSADRCVEAAQAIRTGLDGAEAAHGDYLGARLAIDRGWATARDLDWFGPGVNRVARITDLATTAGIIISADALASLSSPPPTLDPQGKVQLKSHLDEVELFGLDGGGLRTGRSLTARTLPRARTPLVGREQERAALIDLLETHRLVTVLALGGAGKTRLAVEVAHAFDGAAFADLSSARDERSCARVIAEAVGLDLDAFGPTTSAAVLLSQVATQLTSAGGLLVLDNCEHVLDVAAAHADQLLTDCPDLRVLATSRLPLAVAGEFVWQLPSFDAGPGLFMERAAATGAPLPESPEVQSAVESICAQLNQLPLAIELAASQLLGVSLSDLVEQVATHSGASPLRDVVLWSYEQLDGEAQRLFKRLALFESSFGIADISLFDAADSATITQLVRSSLVSTERNGLDLSYRMLQPVRQVAIGLLHERHEFDAAMEELLAGLDRIMPAGYGQGHYDWPSLDRLRPLLPTLWATAQWLEDGDEETRLLQFLANISGVVVVFSDAIPLIDRMLQHIDQRSALSADEQADIVAAFLLTGIASMRTDIATMGVIALFGMQEGPDAPMALAHRSAALGSLYDSWLDGTPQDGGRQLLEQAQSLAARSDSVYEQTAVAAYEAWADLLAGNWLDAAERARSGLALDGAQNAWHLVMTATRCMALLRLGRATEAFEEARAHPERHRFSYWGDLLGYVEILALAALGDFDRAQVALQKTLTAALGSTHMCHCSDVALVAAWVRIYQGDLAGASRLIGNPLAPRGPATLQLLQDLPPGLPTPNRVEAAETEDAERSLTPLLEAELSYLEGALARGRREERVDGLLDGIDRSPVDVEATAAIRSNAPEEPGA